MPSSTSTLQPGHRLADPPRVEPARRVLPVRAERHARRRGGRLRSPADARRRNREHGRRETVVVHRTPIALEQIGDEHADVVVRLRREGRAAGRGISSGVHGRIRDALEELVHRHAALLAGDAGSREVEVDRSRDAAGAVNRQLRVEAPRRARWRPRTATPPAL